MKIIRKNNIILIVVAVLMMGVFASPELASAIDPVTECSDHCGDYALKIEFNTPPGPGTKTYDLKDNSNVTIGNVKITVYGDNTFDWESTLGICTVIVKGGPKENNVKTNVYPYEPPSCGAKGLHALEAGAGWAGLSYINFCYSDDPCPDGNGTNGNGTNGNGTNGNGTNGNGTNGNGDEHCDKCALVVLKRDEDGHPIDGAVFEVDGVQKTIKGGKARWDDLECDTTYEVKEISPNDYSKGIHLGDCGERSTMRVVNKIEVGELEVLGIMEVLPFTGPTIPYSPFIGISTVLAGTFLYILSKPKKKR